MVILSEMLLCILYIGETCTSLILGCPCGEAVYTNVACSTLDVQYELVSKDLQPVEESTL